MSQNVSVKVDSLTVTVTGTAKPGSARSTANTQTKMKTCFLMNKPTF